jgi:hypothetical protein
VLVDVKELVRDKDVLVEPFAVVLVLVLVLRVVRSVVLALALVVEVVFGLFVAEALAVVDAAAPADKNCGLVTASGVLLSLQCMLIVS